MDKELLEELTGISRKSRDLPKKGPAEEHWVAELKRHRYVKVRKFATLMSVCVILQETAEANEIGAIADGAYWVPCWFFMAVLPAARKGDREKAEALAHRVVHDARFKKAMETKYAMLRRVEADNEHTGMWE